MRISSTLHNNNQKVNQAKKKRKREEKEDEKEKKWLATVFSENRFIRNLVDIEQKRRINIKIVIAFEFHENKGKIKSIKAYIHTLWQINERKKRKSEEKRLKLFDFF